MPTHFSIRCHTLKSKSRNRNHENSKTASPTWATKNYASGVCVCTAQDPQGITEIELERRSFWDSRRIWRETFASSMPENTDWRFWITERSQTTEVSDLGLNIPQANHLPALRKSEPHLYLRHGLVRRLEQHRLPTHFLLLPIPRRFRNLPLPG